MHDCPKCGAAMREGFLLDETHGGGDRQVRWAPGEPVKSFWSGLKIEKKSLLPVVTLRCEHCGYLESYARSRNGA